MLTVNGYGFTEPVAPPPPPPTPWGLYIAVAALGYYGWKNGWLEKLKAFKAKATSATSAAGTGTTNNG